MSLPPCALYQGGRPHTCRELWPPFPMAWCDACLEAERTGIALLLLPLSSRRVRRLQAAMARQSPPITLAFSGDLWYSQG